MSNDNYPEGSDTADAPWNLPDAEPKAMNVTLILWLEALDEGDVSHQDIQTAIESGHYDIHEIEAG